MSMYFLIYMDKNDVRTPEQNGFGWTLEKLKTLDESHKMFKMNAKLFNKLQDPLVSTYGLQATHHMNSIESVAIFLLVCGHGASYCSLHGIFKYSSETISRKFEEVRNSMVAMASSYIKPVDHNFSTTHPRIANDHKHSVNNICISNSIIPKN
jgi:hypothetical protein